MCSSDLDPAFIARRLVISAAEDIGLANPNALLLANACFETLMKIGWPEGRIPLAETTIYLATSPKSNSAYSAINDALELVRSTGNLPVPLHLRNAPTKLMKQLGYGQEYKYAHSYEGNFVKQQFLPDELKEKRVTKQPLEYPSAGSTFKRPEGYFAGKLIMDAGLRGFQVGGAAVSEKHCGFVINKEKATASDVYRLIQEVQQEVYRQFGVKLETEVKMVGDFR